MKTLTCPAILLVFLIEGATSLSKEPNPGGQIVKYEPIKGKFFQHDNILLSASALLVVPADEKSGYEYTLEIAAFDAKGKCVAKAWTKTKMDPGMTCPIKLATTHLKAAKGDYKASAKLSAKPLGGGPELILDEKSGEKVRDFSYSVR